MAADGANHRHKADKAPHLFGSTNFRIRAAMSASPSVLTQPLLGLHVVYYCTQNSLRTAELEGVLRPHEAEGDHVACCTVDIVRSAMTSHRGSLEDVDNLTSAPRSKPARQQRQHHRASGCTATAFASQLLTTRCAIHIFVGKPIGASTCGHANKGELQRAPGTWRAC